MRPITVAEGFNSLPPWDAFRYFYPPVIRFVVTPLGGSVKLCDVDPYRVVLIIGATSGTGDILVSPYSATQLGSLNVAQGTNLILHNNAHGILTQCEWWAGGGAGGAQVAVLEVRLREWPTREVAG